MVHVISPATIRLNRPFFNQWFIFLGGKITHVTYRFVIPSFFVPWYTLVSSGLCGGEVIKAPLRF